MCKVLNIREITEPSFQERIFIPNGFLKAFVLWSIVSLCYNYGFVSLWRLKSAVRRRFSEHDTARRVQLLADGQYQRHVAIRLDISQSVVSSNRTRFGRLRDISEDQGKAVIVLLHTRKTVIIDRLHLVAASPLRDRYRGILEG